MDGNTDSHINYIILFTQFCSSLWTSGHYYYRSLHLVSYHLWSLYFTIQCAERKKNISFSNFNFLSEYLPSLRMIDAQYNIFPNTASFVEKLTSCLQRSGLTTWLAKRSVISGYYKMHTIVLFLLCKFSCIVSRANFLSVL